MDGPQSERFLKPAPKKDDDRGRQVFAPSAPPDRAAASPARAWRSKAQQVSRRSGEDFSRRRLTQQRRIFDRPLDMGVDSLGAILAQDDAIKTQPLAGDHRMSRDGSAA